MEVHTTICRPNHMTSLPENPLPCLSHLDPKQWVQTKSTMTNLEEARYNSVYRIGNCKEPLPSTWQNQNDSALEPELVTKHLLNMLITQRKYWTNKKEINISWQTRRYQRRNNGIMKLNLEKQNVKRKRS